jgi:hypothetical protein
MQCLWADLPLPKREGCPLLGNVGYAMKGPDIGSHEPRRTQQNQITGRILQVHGIPAVAVAADEEPPFALQHEDGDRLTDRALSRCGERRPGE